MFQSPSTFLCHRFKFVVASSKDVSSVSLLLIWKHHVRANETTWAVCDEKKNQSHFKASLQGWSKKKKKCKGVVTVKFFAKLCGQKIYAMNSSHKVTFKPRCFLLINVANSRKLKNVAKSAWGNLSPSLEIPDHMDSYWNA